MGRDENITLTWKHIQQLRTDKGGFTSATLKALGVSTKNNTGWPSRLVGTSVSPNALDAAVRGREVFVARKPTARQREEIIQGQKAADKVDKTYIPSRIGGQRVEMRSFSVSTLGTVFVTLSTEDRLEMSRSELQALIDAIAEKTEDEYKPALDFALDDTGALLLILGGGERISVSPARTAEIVQALNGAASIAS